MTYDAWIIDRLAREEPNNNCSDWTREMVAAFPELARVRGHVRLSNDARCAHWWCVTADGAIVDPTASQFHLPVETYEPWPEGAPEPVGACLWCGHSVFYPRSSSCSDECDDALRAEYQFNTRRG